MAGLTICKPYPGVDSCYRDMSRAMSASGLGRFKTFRQKRFKLRETVNEPFFEFGYARIAAISGWIAMMFITRVRL